METVLFTLGSQAVTAGTVLSTAATVGSFVGSITQGSQQAAVYSAQAKQNELAARQEELKGRLEADNIRRGLQSTLASQNAAFAARGISLNAGTPTNIAAQSRREASRDIQLAQFGSGMAAEAERGTAAQNRISASASRGSGYVKAFGSLIR